MSDGDQAARFLYLLGVLVLVASALAVRRIPVAQGLKMGLAWLLIFAAAFVVFALKDDFVALGQRLLGEASGGVEVTPGGEVRIRQSEDGHFWVTAELNGEPVRFLVDSGATVTTVARDTAEQVGVTPRGGFPVAVQTANGIVTVERGRAESLAIGPIAREDVAVHISAPGNVNLIGMNFLSSLGGWSVEGRTLVLRP